MEFPEELRMFFSLVSEGVVLDTMGDVDDDEYDEAFEDDDYKDDEEEKWQWYAELASEGLLAGTGELGNVVDVEARLMGMEPAVVLPKPSPNDVVQPVFASPLWIVFADDGGGNAYAMDLAPGPKGKIGQIVQFDHETFDPPQFVADSLTDFLEGNYTEPSVRAPAAKSIPDYAVIAEGRGYHQTIPYEFASSIEQMTFIYLPENMDLATLREFPKLKKLRFDSRFPADQLDVSPLKVLPQVKTLEISRAMAERIIAAEAFPPNLAKVVIGDFGNSCDLAHIETVNHMREAMGLKPYEIHSWEEMTSE